MSKEIDAAVEALLKESFIDSSIQFAGATTRDDWECDAWRVTIKAPGMPIKREEFDYCTGTGHRQRPKLRVGERPYRPGTLAHEAWMKDANPVKPTIASVLHCLLSDGAALDTSFTYWCADYGFDVDSIKAFNMYQACCKTGEQLRRLFNHDLQAKLRSLLEDY